MFTLFDAKVPLVAFVVTPEVIFFLSITNSELHVEPTQVISVSFLRVSLRIYLRTPRNPVCHLVIHQLCLELAFHPLLGSMNLFRVFLHFFSFFT